MFQRAFVHRWFARPLPKWQLPLLDERPLCLSVSCVIAQQLDWIADFNVSRGGPTAAFTFTRINNDVARAKSIKSINGANQREKGSGGTDDDSKPPVRPMCAYLSPQCAAIGDNCRTLRSLNSAGSIVPISILSSIFSRCKKYTDSPDRSFINTRVCVFAEYSFRRDLIKTRVSYKNSLQLIRAAYGSYT